MSDLTRHVVSLGLVAYRMDHCMIINYLLCDTQSFLTKPHTFVHQVIVRITESTGLVNQFA